MFDDLKRDFKRTAKRITGQELSPEDVEDIIWDLRVSLLESDVAVPVTDKIINQLEEEFTGEKVSIRENAEERVYNILKGIIKDILTTERKEDLIEIIESKKEEGEPVNIVFVGVNGCGKTTTIAKVSKLLEENGYESVLAASDTFRAAGIEQLEKHGENLDKKVIKHKKGDDAAAVAFDAVKHAEANDIDTVLVDTAGRMQTDSNLMEEMKKICRVSEADITVFVGDALTGNDAVEQAKKFDEAVDIDGSILTKMDADARGGAALSIVNQTEKPIFFLGNGQTYEDLVKFDPERIVKSLIPEK